MLRRSVLLCPGLRVWLRRYRGTERIGDIICTETVKVEVLAGPGSGNWLQLRLGIGLLVGISTEEELATGNSGSGFAWRIHPGIKC